MWPFAVRWRNEIDVHWAEAQRSKPRYFNGPIYLSEDVRIEDDGLRVSLVRTDFKSYLFWRRHGYPEAGVLDGFGCALIRSCEGAILLGRQAPGNVNSGLAYPPAGFIDEADVASDGSIDIVKAAAREAFEETGLAGDLLLREPGFFVTRSGPQLAIAVPFRVPLGTAECVDIITRRIAASPDSELASIHPVASLADVADLAMPAYTRALLEALFKRT